MPDDVSMVRGHRLTYLALLFFLCGSFPASGAERARAVSKRRPDWEFGLQFGFKTLLATNRATGVAAKFGSWVDPEIEGMRTWPLDRGKSLYARARIERLQFREPVTVDEVRFEPSGWWLPKLELGVLFRRPDFEVRLGFEEARRIFVRAANSSLITADAQWIPALSVEGRVDLATAARLRFGSAARAAVLLPRSGPSYEIQTGSNFAIELYLAHPRDNVDPTPPFRLVVGVESMAQNTNVMTQSWQNYALRLEFRH